MTDPRMTPLHVQLRDAMAPHLGREIAHERGAALLSQLESVRVVDTVAGVEEVAAIVQYARTVTTSPRWRDYDRPSLTACEDAARAACDVLRAWADAPEMEVA